MKTLRQIVEEAESKVVREELFDLDEEFLMEDPISHRGGKPGKAPSISSLPLILIFRRRSYRYYPDKQIVGLYYNNLTDKYLSVPMGPTPNLNMSEENIEEGIVGDTIESGRKYLNKKLKGNKAFNIAQSIGHNLPGYGDAKAAKEKFSSGDYLGGAVSTIKNLGKAALTGGAVAAGGYGLSKLAGAAASAAGAAYGASSGSSGASQPSQSTIKYGGINKKKFQSKSSLDRQAKSSQAIKSTKLDQAALAPIKENRIKIMRNMIKENKDSVEFSFDDVSIPVSRTVSKRILEVYDSVNRNNKKQIEKMLNESVGSFKKLVAFSIKKQEG